ncbi:hypothetical protein T459_18512 [Capsicum annuum]|uniref:SHSP domain-containing protein n=1 Tax=Capsicum annuum TaxID=4072 RepID=A0A2G2ZEP3_CAPAN|nr:putative protein binding protein [Capsicum annuum]PHT80460.1 hypothetical protein T459_18512 [Capsicum annuum]
MKVHPVPRTFGLSPSNASVCRKKKLRRLPHIFAKVLELPFHSDSDVSIQETRDSLRFVIPTDDVGDDDNIRTHIIEIYPGVTKIVIRGDHDVSDSSLSGLEIDLWRFRLPGSTVPELASACFSDGELVVTVPKGEEDGADGDDHGGAGRLVLVQ